MKKIYLTLLSLLALATTACNDFLDVRPKGEKVENDQFETAKGFEDAIYGVYGSMTDKALYGMDMVWGIPEILGQNLRCDATDTQQGPQGTLLQNVVQRLRDHRICQQRPSEP